jgi:hypothetical protein
MPSSFTASLNPADLAPGPHLIDGATLVALVKNTLTALGNQAALAGGGLSANTPILSAYITEFTTVASANDSCALPNGLAGLEYEVVNSGAQTLRVYCQTANPNNAGAADNIVSQGGVNSTYIAVPANAVGVFSCTTLGRWKSQNQ